MSFRKSSRRRLTISHRRIFPVHLCLRLFSVRFLQIRRLHLQLRSRILASISKELLQWLHHLSQKGPVLIWRWNMPRNIINALICCSSSIWKYCRLHISDSLPNFWVLCQFLSRVNLSRDFRLWDLSRPELWISRI